MRIEFGTIRLCRNTIVLGERKVSYCMRLAAHSGKCSIHPDKPKGIEKCPHGYANVGNCNTCKGKQ
jgi:hypothetical protein